MNVVPKQKIVIVEGAENVETHQEKVNATIRADLIYGFRITQVTTAIGNDRTTMGTGAPFLVTTVVLTL